LKGTFKFIFIKWRINLYRFSSAKVPSKYYLSYKWHNCGSMGEERGWWGSLTPLSCLRDKCVMFTRMILIFEHKVWFQYAGCYFQTLSVIYMCKFDRHECNNNTHKRFPHANCYFHPQSVIFHAECAKITLKSNFDTYACDNDTHECNNDTQSVI
jgi:hypothetical protein